MNLFFDTSVLVKSFHEEKGTDIVTDLILEQNNEVWISDEEKRKMSGVNV